MKNKQSLTMMRIGLRFLYSKATTITIQIIVLALLHTKTKHQQNGY